MMMTKLMKQLSAHVLLLVLVAELCPLVTHAQSSLPLCTISGTVYSASGAPLPGAVVTIHKVVKSGNLIKLAVVNYTANSQGVVTFQLPRGSVAWIEAPIAGFAVVGGVPVPIPDAANASLATLQGAINLNLPSQVPVLIPPGIVQPDDARLNPATHTTDGIMTAADKTKLDGVAAGATANSPDSFLRNRANHTGTQTASTISDFNSAVASAMPNASTSTAGKGYASFNPPSGAPTFITTDDYTRVPLTGRMLYADNRDGGFAAAVLLAAGAGGGMVIVAEQLNVTASMTVPAGVFVSFQGRGSLNISSGQTVTFMEPLAAPLQQIFFGAGLVSLPGGSVFPQWFAGGADWGARSNAADQAISGKHGTIVWRGAGANLATQYNLSTNHTLHVESGIYTSTVVSAQTILYNSNTAVLCDDWNAVLQDSTTGGAHEHFGIINQAGDNNSQATNFKLQGCHLQEARSDYDSVQPTVFLVNTKQFDVSDNWFDGINTIALDAGGGSFSGFHAQDGSFRHNLFTNCVAEIVGVTNGKNIDIDDNDIIGPGRVGAPGTNPIDIEPNLSADWEWGIRARNNKIYTTATSAGLNGGIIMQNGAGATVFQDNEISGNKIYGPVHTDVGTGSLIYGIIVRGAQGVVVRNNEVTRAVTGYAIDFGSSDNIIENNYCYSCGSGGTPYFMLIADSMRNMVKGNVGYDVPNDAFCAPGGPTPCPISQTANILETGTSDYNEYTGNPAFISAVGTHDKIYDNPLPGTALVQFGGGLTVKEVSPPAGRSGEAVLWTDAITHRLTVNNNNSGAKQIVVAGGDINTADQVVKVNGNTPGGNCTNQFVRSLNSSAVPACATVANTDLANSSVTITPGTNLSGGGPVSLGSSITLNNIMNAVWSTGNSSGQSISGAGTSYGTFAVVGVSTTATTWNATETNRQMLTPVAVTLSNFCVNTATAEPSDGTLVLRVRDNAADTALTFTIAAGAGTGFTCDNTHTVSIPAGHLISFSAVYNGATISATVTQWAVAYH
jgi:hypothetical protein